MNSNAPLNVVWTGSQKVEERTITNLEQAMELARTALNAVNPTMIEFFEAEGPSLAIGVGRKHTVVTFQESLNPPYYISLGDPGCDGATSFWYSGEETEYLFRNAVSVEDGQKALAFFVINRTKPVNINWEKL